MAPRKPRWDWKAKGAAELDLFNIPFAAKEYLQVWLAAESAAVR